MARTSKRIARRTSRGAVRKNPDPPRVRMRVPDPEPEDESERYEQLDFDDEEALEEFEERAAHFDPMRRPIPNVTPSTPPPLGGSDENFSSWAAVTYATGTPVMFLVSKPPHTNGFFVGGDNALTYSERKRVPVPVGARGEVVDFDLGDTQIHVRIVDARDSYGDRLSDLIGQTILIPVFGAHTYLEPLVDNWATPKSYRRATPYRVTSGRWRTSRPMRPNGIVWQPSWYTEGRLYSRSGFEWDPRTGALYVLRDVVHRRGDDPIMTSKKIGSFKTEADAANGAMSHLRKSGRLKR